jgi:peptidoglycan-N-acetylglucosamine deacetylase
VPARRPPARRRRRPPRPRVRLALVVALAIGGVAVATHRSNGAVPTRAAAGRPPASSPAAPTAAQLLAAHNAQHRAIARLIAAGHPVYCGGGNEPLVALTFDDGPGPYTRHTLQVLHQHGVQATFFLVAREVVGWPDLKDVPAREAAQGAVGDHTFDHVSLPGLSADDLSHEMGDALTVIQAADGDHRVRLFRPPYGAHDAAVDAKARSLRLLEVLWSVDTADSRGATADQILATVHRDVKAGSIVLLHENRGTTRKALPAILDDLASRGLRAVTVPELLAQDPPSAKQLAGGSC